MATTGIIGGMALDANEGAQSSGRDMEALARFLVGVGDWNLCAWRHLGTDSMPLRGARLTLRRRQSGDKRTRSDYALAA